MPRHWLTTHWPRFKAGKDTLRVYLKHVPSYAAPGLAEGDTVFIYEFKTGPNLLRDSGEIVGREPGRVGIICEAVVASDFATRPPGEAVERYTNGKTANWKYVANTHRRRSGFVPLGRINELLGLSAGNRFFGFNAGRGIKRLEPDEYERLKAEFDPTVR